LEKSLNPRKAEMAQAVSLPLAAGGRNILTLGPYRNEWQGFPDVVIQAPESAVKKHARYSAAKAGDPIAAAQLVDAVLSDSAIESMRKTIGDSRPVVLPLNALEAAGQNIIPVALGERVADRLGLPIDLNIVQVNKVGHTGSSGYKRLALPALFDGPVQRGQDYILVDDFIGQGGTLAQSARLHRVRRRPCGARYCIDRQTLFSQTVIRWRNAGKIERKTWASTRPLVARAIRLRA
jgi:hypothetical protein